MSESRKNMRSVLGNTKFTRWLVLANCNSFIVGKDYRYVLLRNVSVEVIMYEVKGLYVVGRIKRCTFSQV